MKRRRWRRLGITLGILTGISIAIWILGPRLLDLDRHRGVIASSIQRAVGGRVRLGHLSWGFSPGIWVRVDGIAIVDASAFPGDLSVSRAYFSVSIPPLLRRRIVVSRALLERPEVRLRLAPRAGPCTAADGGAACAPGAAGRSIGPAGAVDVEIRQLAIEKGRVTLDDHLTLPGQRMIRVFTDVDITATQEIREGSIAFDVALRDEAPAGLGALKAQGTFRGLTTVLTVEHPHLSAHATLSSLHVDAVTPYLPDSSLGRHLGGSASLTVRYDGDLGRHHRAEGVLDIAHITYTDPSRWASALTSADARITYAVSLTPEELTVETFVVKLGQLSVRAAGRVQDLKERPVVRHAEVSADVPLPELARFIPWKTVSGHADAIRAVLEAGGRIVIDRAVLPEIALPRPLAPAETVLRKTKLTAQVTGMSVALSPSTPAFRNIRGTLRLANGDALLQGFRAQVASVDLPDMSATITSLFRNPSVQGAITGPLRLSQPVDGEVAALLRRIGLEEASGAAEVDLAVAVDPARPEAFQLRGHVGLRDVTVKTGFSPARLEGLAADLALTPGAAQISGLSTIVAVPAAPSAPGGRFTVQLEARIDGWRGRPAITLQHLQTSTVSLSDVATLVPWEKLGDSAKPVQEVLLAGGTVAIEAVTLPSIDLSAPPPIAAQLIAGAKAAASVTDLSVRVIPDLPAFDGITGHLSLAGGLLQATGVRGRMGPLSLPELNVRVTDVAGQPKVAVEASGPVQAAATSDAGVERLLRQFGLKSLTGRALIDMRASYDRLVPDEWEAHGTLVLAGVRAETHPAAVVIDGLRGRVTLDRGKATDIVAEDVTAQVDRSPVRLSGTFLGVGTPGLVVNASAFAEQLNLARVGELLPALQHAGLAGILDMDLHVYLPYAEPGEGRVSGMLATRDLGLRLPAANIVVKDGDGQFILSGDAVAIQQLRLRLNDQAVEVTGHVATPVAPDIHLAVTVPDLDLDRLIPPGGPDTPGAGSSQQSASPIEARAGRSEWSTLARKVTGQLQMQARHGRYRGLAFQDMKLGAAYDHGLLTDWALDVGLGRGQVSATGTADLRDADRVAFVVRPRITSLELEAAATALGIGTASLTGPMSLTGQLRGRTGRAKDLLASLEGTLNVAMGPGTFTRIGRFGATMAKILSFASVRGLISAQPLRDLTGTGLSYRAITTQATFDTGSMALDDFSFRSDAMDMTAQGRVDLVAERLAMQAMLKPLGAAGALLGHLPITGKSVEATTSIHLEAQGPLDDPDIRYSMGTGIETAIEAPAQGTRSMFKGIIDLLEKGARALLGK